MVPKVRVTEVQLSTNKKKTECHTQLQRHCKQCWILSGAWEWRCHGNWHTEIKHVFLSSYMSICRVPRNGLMSRARMSGFQHFLRNVTNVITNIYTNLNHIWWLLMHFRLVMFIKTYKNDKEKVGLTEFWRKTTFDVRWHKKCIVQGGGLTSRWYHLYTAKTLRSENDLWLGMRLFKIRNPAQTLLTWISLCSNMASNRSWMGNYPIMPF